MPSSITLKNWAGVLIRLPSNTNPTPPMINHMKKVVRACDTRGSTAMTGRRAAFVSTAIAALPFDSCV